MIYRVQVVGDRRPAYLGSSFWIAGKVFDAEVAEGRAVTFFEIDGNTYRVAQIWAPEVKEEA